MFEILHFIRIFIRVIIISLIIPTRTHLVYQISNFSQRDLLLIFELKAQSNNR